MIETIKAIETPIKEKVEVTFEKDTRIDLDFSLHEVPIEGEKKKYLSLEESFDEISDEERKIYDDANVEANEVNDRECLTRTDIDYEAVDGRGRTNLERMSDGKPPLIDGKPVELHHIGQKQDAPLAELTQTEHRGPGNDGILHDKTNVSEIDRNEFKKEREQHWKARAEEIITERGEK
ncbi:HNH/ENDO VII family nuclease [Psychrobacillus sp. NEAU-3TGS]|uniref:HNH/ENDO VII family nuclease n=1 Tax=Psychrobacillus sp. NEAU-3TGS TaxID=2995412 RepID=UPI0024997712|nr:HNH/ENDO VII family nuclease [Psychrobacillus sp. NEAU-3TGS]MDI2587624.1 HNH/ENDO VII family nuclease [Psychrobacillus sp. NEAU-3TGS]